MFFFGMSLSVFSAGDALFPDRPAKEIETPREPTVVGRCGAHGSCCPPTSSVVGPGVSVTGGGCGVLGERW